jgi:chromate reductase, NAD(P)H dehydrogenase (quinone)
MAGAFGRARRTGGSEARQGMSDGSVVKTLGFSGSLRKGSLNSAALRAAGELLPEGMSLELADLSDVPIYNDDVRIVGFPASVERLRAQVLAADALLFATPEYNYSIPGMLKNAIDWVSRPPDQPFNGKPVAIMGVTPSLWGTTRAQYHLRQCCVFLNMFPLNKPEVLVAQAASKFDATGALTDTMTRDMIAQMLVALRDWTRRLRPR